jgi:class 3 adenylate cyclase/TolB-like protein
VTSGSHITRRLAAVLIADVVGYSRLMERNEAGTHTRLKAVRDEVTDPAIRSNGGRVVRTVGDGLLVEFGSATAALKTATTIQREMSARNRGVPADERIEYRIGINLGDIIITENDIEGDGVNLAARLQALADPGGICVSQPVQEQKHEDLEIDFLDAGEQRVKNIARPIRVYRVVLQPLTRAGRIRAHWRRWRRDAGLRGTAAGVAVVSLAALAVLIWYAQRPFDPPRLSIAALPFSTVPADAENARLASALHTELRSGLSRLASGGTFAVPRKEHSDSSDPRSVARDLNVRYVLVGALRRHADQLDVQGQLVDGESGATVWSDEFSVPHDAAGRGDRLAAARLASALRPQLLRLEAERARRKPAAERDATDLAAMAFVTIYGPDYSDRDRMREAGAFLSEALNKEPNNLLAMTAQVDWLAYELEVLGADAAEPLKAQAIALAKRAVGQAPGDAEAWSAYASALELTGAHGPALEAIDRSLMLDPANANSQLYRARLLILQQRFSDAVAQARQAAQLAPKVQDVVGTAALIECQALYYNKQYGEAITACERAIGAGTGGYVTSMYLSALYLQTNRPDKAAAAKAQAMAEFPQLRLSTFFAARKDSPLHTLHREYAEQLRKVGFPD